VIGKKRQYFMEEGCLLIAAFIQVLIPGVSSCLALAVHYLKLNLKLYSKRIMARKGTEF